MKLTSPAVPHLKSRDDVPVLTVGQVREWRSEIEADEKAIAEATKRINDRRRRLELAEALLVAMGVQPDDFSAESDTPAETAAEANQPLELTAESSRFRMVTASGEPTWTGAIMKVFMDAEHGLTHSDVMDRIRMADGPFGERLSHDTKRYYTTFTKLEKRGEIVRKNGLFYMPRLLESLPDSSLVERAEPKQSADGPKPYSSAWFILRCLKGAPSGLTSTEIKAVLSNEEGVTPALYGANSFIFNVLKSMQDKGWIVRDDGTKRYIAVPEKSEALREQGFGSHASGEAR